GSASRYLSGASGSLETQDPFLIPRENHYGRSQHHQRHWISSGSAHHRWQSSAGLENLPRQIRGRALVSDAVDPLSWPGIVDGLRLPDGFSSPHSDERNRDGADCVANRDEMEIRSLADERLSTKPSGPPQ